jgi:hypothetical protein
MKPDQSCLERGCGSLRGPVRSLQETMSTRRWGQVARGSAPDWPDQRIGKTKASYIARRAACERGTSPPPFWKTKNQLKDPPSYLCIFEIIL